MFISRNAAKILRVREKFLYSYSTGKATELKEERIKLDKWNINFMRVGHGPHNVLLMPGGLGTMWTDFMYQIEGFDREKFTLIAWDPPGHGKSRPPNKDYTNFFNRDADYAYEFMKALKIPKYSMIGWSDGGSTSFIHAAKYPGSMIKLVGFGTKAIILPKDMDTINSLKDVSKWSDKMRAPMYATYGDFFPKYWEICVGGTEGIFKQNNGNICADILKDIKCPTYILYGNKDIMVDPSHAPFLIKNITNSRLHLYPDGKHNIHMRYAKDFNKRVQDFLIEP